MDPKIEIRPSDNQIDDLINEVQEIVEKNERILITTLTKRMAEELVKFLSRIDIRCLDIFIVILILLERVEIMQGT